MALVIRYEEHRRDFARIMMGPQTQDLADQGAAQAVRLAQAEASRVGLPAEYVGSIKAVAGPPRTLGRNPRRTSRALADHPLAATFEFGSGTKNKGKSGGKPRPQGGYSKAYRVLGKAGARAGAAPTGRSA